MTPLGAGQLRAFAILPCYRISLQNDLLCGADCHHDAFLCQVFSEIARKEQRSCRGETAVDEIARSLVRRASKLWRLDYRCRRDNRKKHAIKTRVARQMP
jgi:hypothetical protein